MSIYSNEGKPFTEENFRRAIEELKQRRDGKTLFIEPTFAICAACSILREPCCEEHRKGAAQN